MYNVIKFQAPFERLKLYDECPYVNLFKSIILQSIIDATNISTIKNESKKDEIEARNWIFSDNGSFQEYCEYAKFDHTYMRRLAKNIIKIHRSNSLKLKAKEVRRNDIQSAKRRYNDGCK